MAHHAHLLAINAAHRERHVCDRAYPSSKLDLVFEYAAATDARERGCELGEGAVWGECPCAPDAVYEEIVFVPFEKGLEPVWNIGSGCGKCQDEDDDKDKDGKEANAAAADAKQESGDNKGHEAKDNDETEGWELLWDADDEASEQDDRRRR
ncbi:hypothetical protein DL769_001321 [Monosporascus sp. CRB-8-3]|nr:hypothetical protein DL769_001321 [Monosporascus sp. CRB-8-3]